MKKVDSFAFDTTKSTGFVGVQYNKLVEVFGTPEVHEEKHQFGGTTYFTWYGEFSDGSKFAIRASQFGMVHLKSGTKVEGSIYAEPTPEHYEEFNKKFPNGLVSRSREKYGKW